MKGLYSRPAIEKVCPGRTNNYPPEQDSARRIRTRIDRVSIDDLTAEFGSPLFVYSERTIRQKHREMEKAFSRRYPHVAFGWSYKTNYLQAICALMHQEGSLAEVVSGMEYEMARSNGIAGPDIVFNGPCKHMPALRRALAEGAMINIDHLDEMEDLEQLAGETGRPASVGLRINLDAGIKPMWSRFGFNLESGQAMDVMKRMSWGGKLIPRGLHCHLGTFILDPEAYGRQVEKMLAFAYEVEDKFGFTMEYLDIGGGLPSRNRLKGCYQAPDVGVPSVDEFAEAVCRALLTNLKPGHLPRLILESGRALVDEAGLLITSVTAEKRLPDGSRAYVLDAGVNLACTPWWYKLNVEVDRALDGPSEYSLLYGPLCMNIDVMDEGLPLPPLPRNTRLILSPVGAYNNTQWMQFIHYRPNVVLIGEKGEIDLIREAEDLSDMVHRQRLPQRLAKTAVFEGADEKTCSLDHPRPC